MMCHAGLRRRRPGERRVLLLPRDVRRRLRRPRRERRARRGADARPEHRERAGRGDRAELPGARRAALARRGLRRAGPVPRRARAAQGLPLRPADDVHRARRPHARAGRAGAFGGLDGRVAEYVLVRGGEERRLGAKTTLELEAGDTSATARAAAAATARRRSATRSACCATCSRARCRAERAREVYGVAVEGGRVHGGRPDHVRGDPERARRGDRRDGAGAEAERVLDQHQDALRLLVRVLRRRAAVGRPGVRAAGAPRLDGRAGAEGGARVRRRRTSARATCCSRTTRTRAACT